MPNQEISRRQLLQAAVAGTAALAARPRGDVRAGGGDAAIPAALGGQPIRRTPFPRWPNFREGDEQAVLPVLRSGVWSRPKSWRRPSGDSPG